MRKVAAVWGTHPNEKDALAAGRSLVTNPIPNVYPVIANRKGVRQGKRFINKNMAYAYPGSPVSRYYEERQAARVMRKLRRLRPDATGDIHSIIGGDTHAMVNARMGVAPWVLGAFWALGIRNIATYEANVHSHYPNAFGLEIASRDIEHRGIGLVRDFFDDLANKPNPPLARAADFVWFTYSEIGGGGLHESVIHPRDFTEEERKLFGSFKPLPPRIQKLLGATKRLYPQSDLHMPNEQGYFTDLLEEVEIPDDSNWPH